MFWSVGIYEIKMLSEEYVISIIVNPSFKKDKNFLKYIFENKHIKFFFVSDIKKHSILSHYNYKITISKILEEVRPVILIQNDYIELENMYIFSLAEHLNNDIKKIVLSMSQASTEKTFSLIDRDRLRKLQKFLKFYKISVLLLLIIKAIKFITSSIDNFIIPKLVGIKEPYLNQSAYNNIDIIPSFIPFDYFFSYEDKDNEYMKKLFDGKNNNCNAFHGFHKICSVNLDEFMGKIKTNEKSLLYLPSVIGCREMNNKEKILIVRWIDLIESLSSYENIKNIGVKFHPSILNLGNNFEVIRSIMKKRLPNATFYDPGKNATELIAGYSHILSDFSSVLLQAKGFENKVLISKDYDDFPNSDGMKAYDQINYLGPDLPDSEIKNIIFKKTKKELVINSLKDKLNELC
tara:strand:- start:6263 stop:7480 length:1218 start_codon:yes stop_codon:yes gene_type:complete